MLPRKRPLSIMRSKLFYTVSLLKLAPPPLQCWFEAPFTSRIIAGAFNLGKDGEGRDQNREQTFARRHFENQDLLPPPPFQIPITYMNTCTVFVLVYLNCGLPLYNQSSFSRHSHNWTASLRAAFTMFALENHCSIPSALVVGAEFYCFSLCGRR